MERLMLLDGNGLIYRGYFALINVPLSTSKGELVNAVFGFSNIVLRGFQDVRPDYVAIAFDLPAPTFRHEQYAEYKATRRPMPDDLRAQFPKVREVVAALRLPVFELAGFEADDVIGTLTREAEGRDLETTIVTGDLDMLQLVTDRTRLMTTRMGVDATVVYDPARIRERYGLEASQMIDFKSLKGDSTDNIPGVPGVGDKTAAKLVSQFGSLDALYSRLDEVTPEKLREKLREHHDRVLASRELVTIHRDLPVTLDLDAARFGDYDRDEVVRLFREYEFRTLIDRLPPLRGASGAQERAVESPSPGGADPAAPGMAPIAAPGGATEVRPSFGSPGARVAAAPRPGSGDGLQLALDFDSVGQIGEAPGAIRPAPAPLPAGDLRGALALLLEEPNRVELVGETEIPALAEWLAGLAAVGAALILDDPRPRQGRALALGVAGEDGRVVVTDGPAASDAMRRALESARVPLVAHEVKPLLVAQLAEDPAAVPTPVAFDTQIAAYLLNASLRS